MFRASSATENRQKNRRKTTTKTDSLIERLHPEIRVGSPKVQGRGLNMLRVPCTLLTQRGLRINSRAFSSTKKLPLTHEFCGRVWPAAPPARRGPLTFVDIESPHYFRHCGARPKSATLHLESVLV